MKKIHFLCILAFFAMVPQIGRTQPPPATTAEQNVQVEIPNKWFKKDKGYAEAMELQKQTGVPIFLYISKMRPEDEKGLCKWWESKGVTALAIRKAIKGLIKVELSLPAATDELEKIIESYRPGFGPTLLVITTSGRPTPIKPFLWVNKRPKLRDPDEIAGEIQQAAGAFNVGNEKGTAVAVPSP